MILKSCRDCGEEKAFEEFPVAAKRSDGRGSYCKMCMTTRSRTSYRKRRGGEGKTVRERVVVAEGLQRCPTCDQVKALDEFPKSRNTKTGYGTYCKPCHNVRSREARDRLYAAARHYHLMHRYGITAVEADEMCEAQGGLCAICQEAPAVHIDHDHVFGNVRGMTCFNCNGGLGQFRDRIDVLLNAIDYLERTTWQRTLVSTGVYRLTSPQPAAARSATSSGPQRPTSSRRG